MMKGDNTAGARGGEDRTLPYRLLAKFGIKPGSSAREVLDASYEMTPDDLQNSAVQDAWESLRITRSRLLVDFFCLDLPAEPASLPLAEGKPLPPMPWPLLSKWPVLAADPCAGNAIEKSEDIEMPARLAAARPAQLGLRQMEENQ
jgi:hypothetical protein